MQPQRTDEERQKFSYLAIIEYNVATCFKKLQREARSIEYLSRACECIEMLATVRAKELATGSQHSRMFATTTTVQTEKQSAEVAATEALELRYLCKFNLQACHIDE